MKSIKIYFAVLGSMVTALFLVSCEKTFDDKLPEQEGSQNNSIVQVFVATVNAARNNVFVDGAKVSGAALVTGNLFPATGPGISVPGGLRAFLVKDDLATSTQLPLSFAENMQVDRQYTVFLYDTITSPKQKTVLTNIVVPEDSTTRLRFANFIYNPTAVPAVDVFSYALNRNVFSNVSVTEVTDFVPYMSRHQDTLYIRETGSPVNIMKIAIAGGTSGLTPKRSYTLVYRGSHRGTRTFSIFANR